MLPSVELSIPATPLFSALLGGVIGSVGTYYGQSKLQEQKKSDRTKWLRRVLLAELESMDALDYWPMNPQDRGLPGGNWLHNQVFESVSVESGSLKADELYAIITFHGRARHARSDIETAHAMNQVPDQAIDAIQSNLKGVKRHRQAAIHLLSMNLSEM